MFFSFSPQRSRWPRGRVLGGSSVLNYMLYIRGNSRDYDAWAKDHGAYGWSWKEVLPYFIKSEDNRDPEIAYNGRQSCDRCHRCRHRFLVLNRTLHKRSSNKRWNQMFCYFRLRFLKMKINESQEKRSESGSDVNENISSQMFSALFAAQSL